MKKRNIFNDIISNLGKQQSERLFNQMVQAETLQPKLSASKVFAIVLATLIHSLTFMVLFGGLFLIFRRYYNIFAIIAGIILLGAAWVLRPNFGRVEGVVRKPIDLKHLSELTNQIAKALNAPNPNGYIVDANYNAGYQQAGIPVKHYIHLGLPFWSVLTAQEKVAILAHELAHSVNGDAARGGYISTAINSLAQWHYLIIPDQIWQSRAGFVGIIMVPLNLFLFLVAKLVHLIAYLLSLLLFHDMQRAEYLADYLAAQVSGTDAAISMLQKIHLYNYYEGTARKIALNNLEPNLLFSELKTEITNISAADLQTNLESFGDEPARLYATHPPTIYRIKLLQSRKRFLPQITMSPSSEMGADGELHQYDAQIARKAVDAYRASLFRR